MRMRTLFFAASFEVTRGAGNKHYKNITKSYLGLNLSVVFGIILKKGYGDNMMNNLKMIRELYGATQEQVATAVNVNRVTVANWETGNSVASSSNQEKLSLYYGVGPEYFYEKELDDAARQIVIGSGAKAREVLEKTAGKRVKEDEFHRAFETIDFKETLDRYMFSMKLLLAAADSGKLDKLETALLINKKMGARLEAIIELRKQEQSKGEPTLLDLIEQIGNDD